MLAYLKGKITTVQANFIELEVNNIGYEIFLVQSQEVIYKDELVKIFIYENIKEDTHDLYGFWNTQDKELFKKLITISGIGPKVASQMLSTYGYEQLISLIITNDIKSITKINGVGPKTAQRLVLELKDSLAKLHETLEPQPPTSSNQDEAISALLALGYGEKEASKSVKAIFDYNNTTEELIKKALQLLIG